MISFILVLLLITSSAYAGSILINIDSPPLVVTTTASQDALIRAFVDNFNLTYDPDRDNNVCAADPDDICLTVSTYLEKIILERILSPVLRSQSQRSARGACASYEALSATDKQTIKGLLGNTSPCSQNNP